MQVQPYACSPAMYENAVLNSAILSATEPDQGSGFIKAFPVMLYPRPVLPKDS